MSDEENKKNTSGKLEADSTQNNSMDPVADINRIRLRLLIICGREKNFDTALTYLSRRGWNAQITSNVLDGFKQITSFEPSFVLLSVNVKTKTLQKLATVIYSTFKIPVLLIGEGTDTLTMKLMMEITANFKLQGQPSGPSIHRTIKNILADLSKSDSQAAKEMYTRAVRRTIKLNPTDANEWKKQKKVGYTFSSDNNENGDQLKERYQFSEEETSELSYKFQDGDDTQPEKDDEADSKRETTEQNFGETFFHDHQDKEFKVVGQEFNKEETLELDQKNEENEEKTYGISEEENQRENNYRMEFEEKPFDRFDEFEMSNESSSEEIGATENPAVAIVDLNKPKPTHFIVKIADKNIVLLNHERKFSPVTENHLWTIQAKAKSFILLCQVHGSPTQAEQFLKALEHDLKEQSTFEIPDSTVTSKVKIEREMSFEQKIDGEVFTYEVKGENLVVRLKFLNVKGRSPALRKSGYNDRLKVSGDDLVVGLNCGADIYIYLPNNNKFIRYLDENTIVEEKQKAVVSDSEAFIIFSSESQYKTTYVRNKAIEKIFKLENPTEQKKKKPA